MPHRLDGWWPMLAAFLVWFGHFMLSWAAVEIWPRQWQANVAGWTLTALALVALAVLWMRLQSSEPDDELERWNRRFGQGTVVLAGVAVVFVALPSLMLLP